MNNYNQTKESSQKPKLMKKSQLKKTILIPNANTLNENTSPRQVLTNEVKESTRKEKIYLKPNQKDNKAEFLLKTIIKAFFLSKWKKKINSMKYYSRSYNPKRANFKLLLNEISLVIKQHKCEYFNEIYQNMNSLPMPKNIKHDFNYGKLRIVNKEVLAKKNAIVRTNQNRQKIQTKNINTNITNVKI